MKLEDGERFGGVSEDLFDVVEGTKWTLAVTSGGDDDGDDFNLYDKVKELPQVMRECKCKRAESTI